MFENLTIKVPDSIADKVTIDQVLSGEVELTLRDIKEIIEYELRKIFKNYEAFSLDGMRDDVNRLLLVEKKLANLGIYISIPSGITVIQFSEKPVLPQLLLESILNFYIRDIESRNATKEMLNKKVRLI